MLNLPSDVQLLILDNVTLPSHLKALCLTSKGVYNLAAPQLYRSVSINVLDEDEVARFQRAMGAGGREKLEATRTLTLMDSLAPPVPEIDATPRRWLNYYRHDGLPTRTATMINPILDQFPSNRLRSFRWRSAQLLHTELVAEFFVRQAETLMHVHGAFVDPSVLEHLKTVKTIDLWCAQPDIWTGHNKRRLLSSFFAKLGSYDNTQKLFIGTQDNDESWFGNTLARCLSTPVDPSAKLEKLQDLSLYGVSLCASLYIGLASIVKFENLTNLTLWKCHFTSRIIAGLAGQSRTVLFNLKRLALCISTTPEHSLTRSLETLLDHCPKVQDLCLEWKADRDGSWPAFLTNSLNKIGRNLRLLSLEASSRAVDEDTLDPEIFKRICAACPNLEQLGYSISEEAMVKFESGFYLNLEPVLQLSKLRTLHLRQGLEVRYRYIPEELPPDIPGAVKGFAAGFFRHIEQQAACQSFEALIIGAEMQLGIQHAEDGTKEYHATHCYRKRMLTNYYGRIHAVPYLVSLFEFRATSEYAEVLDWYSRWTVDHDWMWRVPGRFHDD